MINSAGSGDDDVVHNGCLLTEPVGVADQGIDWQLAVGGGESFRCVTISDALYATRHQPSNDADYADYADYSVKRANKCSSRQVRALSMVKKCQERS